MSIVRNRSLVDHAMYVWDVAGSGAFRCCWLPESSGVILVPRWIVFLEAGGGVVQPYRNLILKRYARVQLSFVVSEEYFRLLIGSGRFQGAIVEDVCDSIPGGSCHNIPPNRVMWHTFCMMKLKILCMIYVFTCCTNRAKWHNCIWPLYFTPNFKWDQPCMLTSNCMCPQSRIVSIKQWFQRCRSFPWSAQWFLTNPAMQIRIVTACVSNFSWICHETDVMHRGYDNCRLRRESIVPFHEELWSIQCCISLKLWVY